ncbi:TPA: hypothetical protein HA246_03945 [Candidatus Woesearchaeota archaeon]|nr:hypothetical protein [Candidatus Woesearchaeota archaeon]
MKNFPYELAVGVYSKLSKQELLSIYKSADLLIMDADETVAPNITVGLANEIFDHLILETLTNAEFDEKDKTILTPHGMLSKVYHQIKESKLAPKKNFYRYVLLSKLFFSGLRLYNHKITSQLLAKLIHRKSNHKKILKIVVNMLTDEKIRVLFEKSTGAKGIARYLYSKDEVENSLYPGVKDFVGYLSQRSLKSKTAKKSESKKLKKIIISESFSIDNNIINSKKQQLGLVEHYLNIFSLNALISNQFICEKEGIIKDIKINIQSAEDKKRFAQEAIAKYKAKNVIVMANDWEDWEMCTLPEVKLVILRNPPKGLEKYAHVVLKEGYAGLILK